MKAKTVTVFKNAAKLTVNLSHPNRRPKSRVMRHHRHPRKTHG